MPFDHWLRGPLRDVLEDSLSAVATRKRGLLDVKNVGRLKQRFLQGKIDWSRPWLAMMTELWCREVLDSIDKERAS
jgi:asparagine synthase (glutamine-hydrolysing)